MTRFALSIIALLFLPSLAQAKDITITLTDADQKVIMGMMDNALKSGGLANLQAVTSFLQKLQAAAGPLPTPTGQPEPVKPEDKPKDK